MFYKSTRNSEVKVSSAQAIAQGIPEENVLMLCAMDAAGYAENVNLYTAGHALRSITRGSAAADELLSLLRLDPARYRFILAQSVGK